MAKKKSSVSLASKVAILKIPPEAWDAIIPHSHKVSQHLVEYMAAGVVRDISAIVKNKEIKSKLFSIGQEMARVGSQGLIQGWEDGDDICPPWPPFTKVNAFVFTMLSIWLMNWKEKNRQVKQGVWHAS